ncbi:hypothetical protein AAW12_08900 [Sphingobacterium sp. Ag1]|uniref:hypothetical protein n=1 Tax=Sphingobacterium sp. Ag1 TaxID=1643451 RepID=UPI000628242E|nr:hypothetical protein [Sphingobacterium sp. Ag1]KKO91766.1 hypothetical protein AAW12_08900 [Sphingobacterium sp. Ag1]
MDKLTHFRIDYTDVILQDYEDGKGKIIISNDDRDINLSYYWSSMGQGYNLSKFILKTNDEYLIRKLGESDDDGPINMKKTMASVRSFIKNETSWRFYMNLEADKSLRTELNDVQESSFDKNDFVRRMQDLDPDFPKNTRWHEFQSEWDEMLQGITIEPWYFIVNDPPETNVWLSKFLPKIREHLKKESEGANGI